MKKYSITSKYTAAVPRSQRRKNVEGRGVVAGYSAGGGSGVDRSYVDANFVTLATEQVVTAHKDFAAGISMYGIPWEYDVERDVWTIKGNVIITKGLATYSSLKEDDVLSVFDGLPIDNNTLQWQEAENGKILVAVGGGSDGGLDESKLQDYLDEKKYVTESWVTGKNYALKTDLDTVSTKLNNFLEGSDTNSIIDKWSELEVFLSGLTETDNLATILSGKANKSTTLAGYGITNAYTKTEVQDSFLGINDIAVGAATLKRTATSTSYLVAADNGFNVMNPWNTRTCWFGYGLPTGSAYATTNWRFGSSDGTGVASGNIHCGSVSIGGAKITYDSTKNAIILPTNVVIEGGLATYTKLSGFTDLDVMGGVVVDGTTIAIVDGALKYIGETSGGGGGITLDDVADYLSDNDYITSSGNANSATNIVLGTVSPSSTTSYYPAMVTGTTNGSKYGIKVFGNPVRYALKAGTTSATGIAELILGNSTNSGSSGNSEGALCLYPASGTYATLKAPSVISSYTNYLPKSSGTLLNDNSLKTINGYSLVGSGDITISGGTSGDYLSIYGGTIEGDLGVTGRITVQDHLMAEHSSNPWLGLSRAGVNWFVQVTSKGILLGKTSATSIIVDASGNLAAVGAVTENSDRKLKNIEYEGDGLGLDVLKKVKVAKWHWKDNKRDKRLHIGGVADNLAEVMPEVVFESEEEDGTTTSSIAYGKAGFSIAASLIAPVVRHEDRIKELEKNIEKMQKELNQLRKTA